MPSFYRTHLHRKSGDVKTYLRESRENPRFQNGSVPKKKNRFVQLRHEESKEKYARLPRLDFSRLARLIDFSTWFSYTWYFSRYQFLLEVDLFERCASFTFSWVMNDGKMHQEKLFPQRAICSPRVAESGAGAPYELDNSARRSIAGRTPATINFEGSYSIGRDFSQAA